ncbi:LysR family transcriptional regulator [Roseomonas hellenica]|uniref:LysR family transcriptional regulator n=1 Tax=Plastoroseomonas hellenica TaxID=2687306 RepID=A0ABS5EXU4_9PROT|nr:LysR family transcriptional regulator [Plastoroseomonas hellenica]MBR0665121.1 LysR family transcriptional regulator [Plastoroseomonas hellenica]
MLHEIDLSRADLNLLVLFEAVLREGHVGRAAARLNLSASAVSHGLGRLRRLLNDPVFLRTPKGVVPTARALDLAGPIGLVLAGARGVIATARPFDPARSARQFVIGAPDGVSALFLQPLLAVLRRDAPGVDIRLRQLLPPAAARVGATAWEPALAELEARTLDIAVAPFEGVPARFAAQVLREEDFVILARAGHPFAAAPTLPHYCAASHLVVSMTGDANGFVDDALAERGLSRRVALTVPSFFMALAVVAETDLIAAVPRGFAAAYAPRSGVTSSEAPLPLPRFRIQAVASKAALQDAGIAWLGDALLAAGTPADAVSPSSCDARPVP